MNLFFPLSAGPFIFAGSGGVVNEEPKKWAADVRRDGSGRLVSLSQGGVSPREPPSNASLCARVTTLLVRQGSGSAAVPQTVRPRARKLIPQARKLVPSRPSSVHRATLALAPRADEPAAIL